LVSIDAHWGRGDAEIAGLENDGQGIAGLQARGNHVSASVAA